MKKYLLVFTLFITTTIKAQVPEDALRYSFYPQSGTARNMAIGGAMGSLGGDLNATFVNPAGLGFYKTGEFVLTPGFLLNNNKINFRDAQSQSKKNAFSLGTSGWVWGFGTRYKPKVSNAVSLAITQTANFNNSIQYKGLNDQSSFAEQFAEEFAKANFRYKISIDDVLTSNSPLPYGSAPALLSYLIDTFTVTYPNGTKEIKVKAAPEFILDAGQALRQEMSRVTKGGISEVAIAFAHNNDDKWFWGATLGVPIVKYNSVTTFKEFDTSNNNANSFKQFEYRDDFTTKGVGVNAKLGIIFKPAAYIRVGLAVHTPTYMALTDTRTTFLSATVEKPWWTRGQDTTVITGSTPFTNGQAGEATYIQTTPFKVMLSASYVFREISNVNKQRAFITADVEYVHHKGSRFHSDAEAPTEMDKAYYKELGDVVKEIYKGAFNFRVGGEIKFSPFMGRLGFAYYGNPYKDVPYKGTRMLLSGGLGYRNKGVFIDLTYVHTVTKDVDLPYRLEDRENTYADVKQQRGNIVATVGFKF
jgi:hypothetical protein